MSNNLLIDNDGSINLTPIESIEVKDYKQLPIKVVWNRVDISIMIIGFYEQNLDETFKLHEPHYLYEDHEFDCILHGFKENYIEFAKPQNSSYMLLTPVDYIIEKFLNHLNYKLN